MNYLALYAGMVLLVAWRFFSFVRPRMTSPVFAAFDLVLFILWM